MKKTPGSLDMSGGSLGWFITYCPCCKTKIILRRDEYESLRDKMNCKQSGIRLRAKEVLTHLAEAI